ncbi:MAG TPA: GPP34 family phosphoprotein [Streptosporangiaceae bacterium]|jgi:hypothetical protein|nr:GPP34 family phosphoprotein [Streptosporangiaceae bacterium]
METLGEDLALLSVGSNGRVQQAQRLGIALAGSELVRLAAHGTAGVEDGRIVVRDAARTGSAELDLALESLAQARRPPKAKAWVGHPRRGIVAEYLERLAESGALRSERAFLGTRWRVTDPGRAAAAAARLDAIARSSGPVDTAGAAFGGLAHAAGLSVILYRGLANREPRARLKRIAEGKAAGTGTAPAGVADAAGAADAVSRAAEHAVTETARAAAAAAADAATQAAVDAATQAAVHASTQAAVHAAVHAATQAADAGGHGGAAGHHGH